MRLTLRRGGNTMSHTRSVLSMARRHKLFSIATLAGLLGLAATMVPASISTASPALGHIGGSVSLWAEWTSTEQQDFEAVLAPFQAETGVNVIYSGKGSNMDRSEEHTSELQSLR